MNTYLIDFDYTIREGSSVTLQADDFEQATYFAKDYINDTYGDVLDVEIVNVQELKQNNGEK